MSEHWVQHFHNMAKKPHKSKKFHTLKADASPTAGLPVTMMSPVQQAVQKAEYGIKNERKKRKYSASIKGGGSSMISVLD